MKTLWLLIQPGGLGGASELVAGVSRPTSSPSGGGGGPCSGGSVCVQVRLAHGQWPWLGSVSGVSGREATSETDAAHPAEQGGSEEQATAFPIRPSLIPGPHPPSSQPGKTEVWLRLRLRLRLPNQLQSGSALLPQLSETDTRLG